MPTDQVLCLPAISPCSSIRLVDHVVQAPKLSQRTTYLSITAHYRYPNAKYLRSSIDCASVDQLPLRKAWVSSPPSCASCRCSEMPPSSPRCYNGGYWPAISCTVGLVQYTHVCEWSRVICAHAGKWSVFLMSLFPHEEVFWIYFR